MHITHITHYATFTQHTCNLLLTVALPSRMFYFMVGCSKWLPHVHHVHLRGSPSLRPISALMISGL